MPREAHGRAQAGYTSPLRSDPALGTPQTPSKPSRKKKKKKKRKDSIVRCGSKPATAPADSTPGPHHRPHMATLTRNDSRPVNMFETHLHGGADGKQTPSTPSEKMSKEQQDNKDKISGMFKTVSTPEKGVDPRARPAPTLHTKDTLHAFLII